MCEFQDLWKISSDSEAVKIQSAARGHKGRQKAAALAAAQRRQQVSGWNLGFWEMGFGSRHIKALFFFPGCWHVAPSKNEDSTVMLNCEWGSDRFRFRCYEMWKAWKIECTCNTDTFHSDCFLVSVHPMVYNLGAEAACCHRLSLYNVKAEKGLQPAFSSF